MKEENIGETKNGRTPKLTILFIIAFCVIFVVARYTTDKTFRESVETTVFKRSITNSESNSIDIDGSDSPGIYAYDNYVGILSKNVLSIYNQNASLEKQIDINLSLPYAASNGKYLALAERNGQKIYLISGTNILWENTVEGAISRINVNENGYVSVIIQNTIYKSVIIFYDNSGKEVFTTYISTNLAVCTDISKDNKYLAIGEVDYTGTLLKSYVKIISVDKAETSPDNSIIYTYESGSGEFILNINYGSKDTAVCMFNSYIQSVSPSGDERIYEIDKNNLFVDVNLDSKVIYVDKQLSGLFSYEYELFIKKAIGNSEKLYILNNELPKSISASSNYIVLNFGNQLEVVNSNGWLIKHFSGTEQINSVVIGDSVVGVIYKNRVEVIKL